LYERLVQPGASANDHLIDKASKDSRLGPLDDALATLDSTEPRTLVDLAVAQTKFLGTDYVPGVPRNGAGADSLAFTGRDLNRASMEDLVRADLSLANLRALALQTGQGRGSRQPVWRQSRVRVSLGVARIAPKLSAWLRATRVRLRQR
jgi:hypothetical protein